MDLHAAVDPILGNAVLIQLKGRIKKENVRLLLICFLLYYGRNLYYNNSNSSSSSMSWQNYSMQAQGQFLACAIT